MDTDVQRGYRAYITREWRNEQRQVEHVLQGATGKIWLKPEYRAACKPNWVLLRGVKTRSADFKLARQHLLGTPRKWCPCGDPTCNIYSGAPCRCGIYIARDPQAALYTALSRYNRELEGRPASTRVLASCIFW